MLLAALGLSGWLSRNSRAIKSLKSTGPEALILLERNVTSAGNLFSSRDASTQRETSCPLAESGRLANVRSSSTVEYTLIHGGVRSL